MIVTRHHARPRWGSLLALVSAGVLALLGVGAGAPAAATDGITWTTRTSAADNSWTSVTYGNGLFVAVASGSGSGNRVMTSPDGITWTTRTSAAEIAWSSVTYGNSLFVAVATTGTGNRVMTSPDGITWTTRTSASNNDWQSVTYGNGLFVAVSSTGTGNRVMTSPDGITWTTRTSAANNGWRSVTYGNGLFVAVASLTGTGTRVMTSPDGETWTTRTSADNNWRSVVFANGTFVAVSTTAGTGNQVMTSNPALLSQSGDTLTITPPSGTAPSQYVLHYNTPARVTAESPWGIWAKNWPTSATSIDLAATQSKAGCETAGAAGPATCYRPAAIGLNTTGTTYTYRPFAKVGSTWEQGPNLTVTRP